MDKEKQMPELRFPEFEGAWEEKKLGELFSNSRAKGNDSLPIYSVSQSRGMVPRDLLDRNIQKDAKSTDNLKAKPNDLVYNTMRMWQGAVGLATTDCMVSPAYVILSPKKDVDSFFFLNLFEKNRSKYLFTAYSYGLTLDRLRLYYKDFASIKLRTPEHSEQQKITDFLGKIDQHLQLLQKKKTQLETYKKGVMQKLFSQELRFKDENGQNFPDWEEKRLGEIATFSKGKGISKSDIDEEGNLECIRYGELYTTYSEIIEDVKSKTNLDSFNLVLSEINDVIIPASGESRIDIATASCVMKSGVGLGGDLNIIKTKSNGVFLSYYLNNSGKMEIAKMAQGISVVHLYASQLKLLKISIPSLLEQQKIATFLSTLDEVIEKVTGQIAETGAYKRGLLQRMFV